MYQSNSRLGWPQFILPVWRSSGNLANSIGRSPNVNRSHKSTARFLPGKKNLQQNDQLASAHGRVPPVIFSGAFSLGHRRVLIRTKMTKSIGVWQDLFSALHLPHAIRRAIRSRPVSQTLGHSLHQVKGEVRRLLHQKLEAVLVNGCQFTVRLGYGCGAAGSFIDQRHLSQKIIDANRFNHIVMKDYVHFPFEDNIHLVACVAFLENCVTGLKGDEELGIPKKMAELHAEYSYARRDKFQVGFWMEPGALRMGARPEESGMNSWDGDRTIGISISAVQESRPRIPGSRRSRIRTPNRPAILSRLESSR